MKLFNCKSVILLLSLLCAGTTAAFKYEYKGAVFNCAEEGNGVVAITSWSSRSLKNVVIPAIVKDEYGDEYRVRSINVYSSGSSYSVEELEIEEGVQKIEKRCFHDCFRFTKVKLPASLVYIGKYAFGNVKDRRVLDISADSERLKGLLVESGVKFPAAASASMAEQPKPAKPEAKKKDRQESSPPAVGLPSVASAVAGGDGAEEAPASIATPVIRVVSFTKSDALMTRTDYRPDNTGKPCALVKITFAKEADYSGDFIPEPLMSYIAFNQKGKDCVWMVDKATSLYVYSNKREFEPCEVNFNAISGGKIPALETGCVYELKLRLGYEK